jgi:hypothetical protein
VKQGEYKDKDVAKFLAEDSAELADAGFDADDLDALVAEN